VVSNLNEFLSSVELGKKEDILKNVGDQKYTRRNIHKYILWKSMASGNSLVTNILQNIFFIV